MEDVQIKFEGEGDPRAVALNTACGRRLLLTIPAVTWREALRFHGRANQMLLEYRGSEAVEVAMEEARSEGERKKFRKKLGANDPKKSLAQLADFLSLHISQWEVRKRKFTAAAEGAPEQDPVESWDVEIEGKPEIAALSSMLHRNAANATILFNEIFRAMTDEGDINNIRK